MDSSRSWAGRRQCPLSCQAKGRSNRIKKSSPLFIISQDETRDNPGICGDKAGQWKTQWDCGWVTAEKPKTNTSTETHWEVLSEKFHSQWIIGIKSSWKVNVYTRTYRWRWAKKKMQKLWKYCHKCTAASNRKLASQRTGPQGSPGRGWTGANRTIAGGNQNMQLSVSFRLELNCTRTEKPQKGRRTPRTNLRKRICASSKHTNSRDPIAGPGQKDRYIYICLYVHPHTFAIERSLQDARNPKSKMHSLHK